MFRIGGLTRPSSPTGMYGGACAAWYTPGDHAPVHQRWYEGRAWWISEIRSGEPKARCRDYGYSLALGSRERRSVTSPLPLFALCAAGDHAPGVSQRTFHRKRARVGQTTVTPDTTGTAVKGDDLGDGPGA